MEQVIRQLEQLRHRVRAMLLSQRIALVVAFVVLAVIVLVTLDYVLRLPSGLRFLLLAGGLSALGWFGVRYVRSAARFRPSLTQLALRIEKTVPPLRGYLASGVEFAHGGESKRNPLADRAARNAAARFGTADTDAIFDRRLLLRSGALCGGAVILALLLVVVTPVVAGTGLKRLLLPFGATQWPARTAVASRMGEILNDAAVYPRGRALLFRAQNETRGEPDGRVNVRFRYERDGVAGDWSTVLLTHQGEGVHERLIDTDADAIEFSFQTDDAETALERVALVPPPAVRSARAQLTPPAYAAPYVIGFDADLGPGVDDRAVTEDTALVGAKVKLELELNKPLPVPDGAARAAWIGTTLDADPLPEDLAFTPVAPGRWQVTWTLRETTTLGVDLVDEYGLHNDETIRYRVRAAADTVPSATITDPAADDAVLPTAIVPLSVEGKDDVALARLGLVATVARGGSSERTPMDFSPFVEPDRALAVLDAELDLATFASALGLQAGDVVVLQAEARDVFTLDGGTHAPVLSAERRLRLVSELDFAAELRRQLSSVRQAAMRIDAMQAELLDDVADRGVEPGQTRAQAELGERIADQREALDDLTERLESNRLEDPQLRELLQQSRDALDYAGRAATKAVQALEEASQAAGQAGEPGEDGEPRDPNDPDASDASETPDERPVVEAQQEVRDELADLIELLDRDEDTWLIRRQLESLLAEQNALAEATGAMAQETMGLSRSDMSESQLSELDRIAQQQRDLRDQMRRLTEEMRRRADAMEEVDPQAADGMRAAAETAERREVDRDMEAAADRVDQNQLQTAGAAQQSAMQTLERMNEDLDESNQARAAELLRQLSSLLESIDRLVVIQENELIALDTALARSDYTGRDRAMIRLAQNTQAVAADARGAGQPARRIARALDRAGDAQGEAVTGLRAVPLPHAQVVAAEETALERLLEAKALADELEAETQEEQVREEREALIEQYRELAERQVAVREETLALTGVEKLNRRQLVDARRLGNVQDEIRTGLADVAATTEEITGSEVFSLVHRLMDEWSRSVSDTLWDGRATTAETDRQARIADSIARQIEAIEETMTPPDPFDDGGAGEEQQAGGGQGGSPQAPPLIPPIAEIKRLHGLQEQVYNETKSLDGRSDIEPAVRREFVRELGALQRELLRLGEAMLEAMQQDAAAPPAGRPSAPDVPDEMDPS